MQDQLSPPVATAPQTPTWYDREGKPRYGDSPDLLVRMSVNAIDEAMDCLHGMTGLLEVIDATVIRPGGDGEKEKRQFADQEFYLILALKSLNLAAKDRLEEADHRFAMFEDGQA